MNAGSHVRAPLVGALLALTICANAGASALPLALEEGLVRSGSGVSLSPYEASRDRWCALQGMRTYRPRRASEMLLVGSERGLFGLRIADGQIAWHLPYSGDVFRPVVEGNLAYIGTRAGQVAAVSIAHGVIRWQRQLEGWVYPPAVSAGRVVVGGSAHVLRALDEGDGRIVWTLPLDQELVYRPVATATGDVIVTTFAGAVLAVRAADGMLRWKVDEPVPALVSEPAAGAIVLARWDGVVIARDLATGSERWRRTLGARPLREPEVSGASVLVAGDNGRAMVIDARDGGVVADALIGPDEALVFKGQAFVRVGTAAPACARTVEHPNSP